MKILFTIPHFYKPLKQGHGSQDATPTRRIHAMREALSSLYQLFGAMQCEIDLFKRTTVPVNHSRQHKVDIVVCTTGENHLVRDLSLPACPFYHHNTQAEPKMLGFECHQVLRNAMGNYNYYCFMEDDLVIQDPLFFEKLRQFNQQAGPNALLQPNRFETSAIHAFHRVYVDGDLRPQVTQPFQDVTRNSVLEKTLMGMPLRFFRPSNPHSGCFFLTEAQLSYWVSQPHFLDRDVRFISPLESSASLSIMKTFNVYKPARENANFLEIKHQDIRFLPCIGKQVSVNKILLPV